MEKIEVNIDGRKLVAVMKTEKTETGSYLTYRRPRLIALRALGKKVKDFAAALGVADSQGSDMLHGRAPIGDAMIERINRIDPEYDLIPLIGVVEKTARSVKELL